jgi:hypothetical protein
MKTSALLVLCACSTQPRLPPARFANTAPVTVVNDRLDVPAQPAERGFLHFVYHYDGIVQRRLSRALELPRARRALAVNSLDEAPDSTWFTNRIGVRDLTLDELRAGPTKIDSPEAHKPWTVKSTKVGGSEIGFVIVDARGERFLLKFDPAGFAEQETATHVIVDRILWACGYNTTEDYIVHFTPADLVLAPDAYVKEESGHKYPLDRAGLEDRLARVDANGTGAIRALASRWLPGKPLGGHPAEGVRGDDPNDRISHQLRRDLRGLYAFAAWLDHVDIQESNFLDMWVQDPADAKRHYVKHYLLDFGKSMGVMATTGADPRRGYDYVVDIADMTRSLIGVGTLPRAWEQRRAPSLRGVGLFDADSFDPGAWKPDSPAYVPFLDADRFDKFWAAKILIRFTREQLRAIVETAQLSDPKATDYLTDTLVARQRATAAYWFARVNPLDHFEVAGETMCFDDMLVAYRLGTPATFEVTSYGRDAHALGEATAITPNAAGRACVVVRPSDAGDAYTIVEIAARRPRDGRTLVHLARDPASARLRVVGIWRP